MEETNALRDALAAVIEPVTFRFLWRPRLKDPQDEMVLRSTARPIVWLPLTCGIWPKLRGNLGFRAIPPGEIWRELLGEKHERK